MSDEIKDELFQRIHRELQDSFDEELEMEIDDDGPQSMRSRRSA